MRKQYQQEMEKKRLQRESKAMKDQIDEEFIKILKMGRTPTKTGIAF